MANSPGELEVARLDQANRRDSQRLLLYRSVLALFLLGFWEFASGRLIDSFWVSSPLAIALRTGMVTAKCLLIRLPNMEATSRTMCGLESFSNRCQRTSNSLQL